jgi:cephalosporin-C deacetylase
VTDPTYGYDLDALLKITPPDPPDDFAEFWRGRREGARGVAPDPVMRESETRLDADLQIYDVTFATTDGLRLGGWLALPADGAVNRGLVVGHGYGGREAPIAEVPVDHAAVLFFCSRGEPARSLTPDIPSVTADHVLHGIASRDTYVHGGCAADVWCAVSALTALIPAAAGRIDYLGGSFGGGIGALAVPWDERIQASCLRVPSFGHHPLRLTMPCLGSGESVRRYVGEHPEAVEVLRYFDAATAATFTTTPTHVAAALADPSVPPPGQFAVHNALAGPQELFVLTAGHSEYPGQATEEAAMLASQRKFLSR